MDYGSKPADGGFLSMNLNERRNLRLNRDEETFVLPYVGSAEYIDGKQRFCLWLDETNYSIATRNPAILARIENVRNFRLKSTKVPTRIAASSPYSFVEVRYGVRAKQFAPFIIPIHTGEKRDFLPVGLLETGSVISNAAFALYDAPLWNMALIASRIHLVWIATVCGKLKTDFRYSNTLGWNTFPVPVLTAKNKADLTQAAENILLAREAHFPKTIADLYDPDAMPENLRAAHAHNDEVLERIYIGRRFKNDTERLEKLFEMYTAMIAEQKTKAPVKKGRGKKVEGGLAV